MAANSKLNWIWLTCISNTCTVVLYHTSKVVSLRCLRLGSVLRCFLNAKNHGTMGYTDSLGSVLLNTFISFCR
ncbi:hypothetical protein PF005_g25711 [Phytophthora fragariae]|uniref:Uncharacterized protein n=2 Tax=Phytophthora TaxID=4783 RepID=A0A6A3W3I7_9STRA|nr:hypothetical protein PF003_g13153 [Phytophthora fragariae]KAE8967621.1 hypothetical protein PR002_g28002 [Phytophthora rubi]KAE8923422.1 hypothetical protein PF009_g26323 [Phytophthora fragariae]KAE8968515.1 hypothetical protein PR001_g27768 [Phytophthora rubi]KAE9062567.1 hypothetical protein PF006_g31143 [Phytophthora fragariae]